MSGNSVEYQNDFYKLSNLVNEWIADNDLTEHWHAKMLSFLMKGFRHLSLHSWQEPYSSWLTVGDLYTATLPENYVMWTKVGLKVGQYVKVLGVNAEMHELQRSAEDDVVSSLPLYQMPNGIDIANYGGPGYDFLNVGGSGSSCQGYGGGLPSKGHYKFVQRGDSTWEIEFDYDVRVGSDIIVEYISDGFNPNGETIVNALVANYCHAVMDFKYEEKFNPTRTEASITRMGRALAHQEFLVRAAKNDLDPKTMITISRREARFSPHL